VDGLRRAADGATGRWLDDAKARGLEAIAGSIARSGRFSRLAVELWSFHSSRAYDFIASK